MATQSRNKIASKKPITRASQHKKKSKRTSINLKKIPTTPPQGIDKKMILKETKKLKKEFQDLHFKLFAQEEKALLIVMQGIDAAGKGSAIKDIFSGLHPAGIIVNSFRVPTREEMAHPYLWRAMARIPSKGTIGIFDRSHYEDVLVPKVLGTVNKATIKQRYQEINQREHMLEANNVTVLKFFYHINKKRQKEKLLRRLVRPERYWKHNSGDWETRKHWDEYQDAFEQMIENCNTPKRNIIPTDKGRYKRYLILKITVDTLKSMNVRRPKLELDETSQSLLEEAQKKKKQLLK